MKNKMTNDNSYTVLKKYVESIKWIRGELKGMDSLINPHPMMGIKNWDDAVCVGFGGKKLVISVDGPYKKRLVMKSALIHASTDVVVKGARPLFALDTLVGKKKQVKEMLGSLKKQAQKIKIPILGGNTMLEEVKPRANITVVGELLEFLEEPIRDCSAEKGNILMTLGEPIWGEQKERIRKARLMFECWFELLERGGIDIKAAKDITKGGLVSTIYEIAQKSGLDYEIEDDPFHMTRNLDNFLIAVSKEEVEKIKKIGDKKNCRVEKIGKLE